MPSTEYICVATFTTGRPDLAAWEGTILELGLHREAFTLSASPTGNILIRFWEPDRTEALGILEKLDGLMPLAA